LKLSLYVPSTLADTLLKDLTASPSTRACDKDINNWLLKGQKRPLVHVFCMKKEKFNSTSETLCILSSGDGTLFHFASFFSFQP
jgi:hypothetical protein